MFGSYAPSLDDASPVSKDLNMRNNDEDVRIYKMKDKRTS